MLEFDRRFPWLKDAAQNAPVRIGGLTLVAEPGGEGGMRLISLAQGTFLVPLPEGWVFRPSGVFRGYVETPDGLLLLELDSFEDAEAAQGGARLLGYLGTEFQSNTTLTPAEALADIQVSLPLGGEGDLVWVWLEPLGCSHLRKLSVRHTCAPERDNDFRQWFAGQIGQWLRIGSFIDESTMLDRNASTAELERVNFQDTVLFRVPRRWKVAADSKDEAGRTLYAVDSPDTPETLWIRSILHAVGEEGEEVPDERLHAYAHLLARGVFGAVKGWDDPRIDRMDDGDLLIRTERLEEDGDKALRRAAWARLGLRDHLVVTALIDLCTNADHLDTEAERRIRALVDREACLASILRWRPRWAP